MAKYGNGNADSFSLAWFIESKSRASGYTSSFTPPSVCPVSPCLQPAQNDPHPSRSWCYPRILLAQFANWRSTRRTLSLLSGFAKELCTLVSQPPIPTESWSRLSVLRNHLMLADAGIARGEIGYCTFPWYKHARDVCNAVTEARISRGK